MSDSGFVDEAPRRDRSGRAQPPTPDASAPHRGSSRTGRVLGSLFVLVVVAFVGLAAYAWSGRLHAEDLDAYAALSDELTVMDRSLTPLGHGEEPPCSRSTEGVVTRTYPPSTGPAASQLVGYLLQSGWSQAAPEPPSVARLTRTESGHVLTVDVEAPSIDQLVTSLRATSAASAFACLLH